MVTNNMPQEKLLRLAAVCEWVGCKPWDVEKWVRSDLITRIKFPNQRGFYDRDEIARKILNNGGRQ